VAANDVGEQGEGQAGWPSSATPEPHVDGSLARGLLDRILCGVDSTAESLEALRQADRLREPGGSLSVVTVLELATSAQAGWAASFAATQLEAEAEEALDAARAEVSDATFHTVEGPAAQALVSEAERAGATLVAVGTSEGSRAVGIALGSVATTLLHSAPCSVLVARPGPPDGVPRSIVVGLDGSDESAAAAALAFGLGERFGVETRAVTAREGKDFDLAAVHGIAPGALVEDGDPVDVLAAAAADADLLVVGSRGLRGLRALGSVSERVAHRAPCSVLVVRREAP
jgi:nucleotide-binding universal stress UspA family protein